MNKYSLKVESLLLKKLREGKSLEDFVIAPMGLGGRSLEADVLSIAPIKTEKDKKQTGKTRIEVRREGLYDALPEGLFHEIVNDEEGREEEKNAKVEREARKFFLPYEQEFFRARFLVEQYERALIDGHSGYFQSKKEPNIWKQTGLSSKDLDNQYSQLWNISKSLTEAQIRKLIGVLPYAPYIVGDQHLTQHCFEILLGKPVVLTKKAPKKIQLKESFAAILGTTILGKNSILGNQYYDGTPVLELKVKAIEAKELIDYLPNGKERIFIHYISDFFIPFDVDFEVACEVKEKMLEFCLYKKGEKEDSRLGYSSKLS